MMNTEDQNLHEHDDQTSTDPIVQDSMNEKEVETQETEESSGEPPCPESENAIDVLAADHTAAIEQLREDLAKAEERALRAQADQENLRKRMNRLLEEERKYGPLSLARELLPVLDNLQRAIDAASQSHDGESLLEGVQLVAQQLESVLAQHNCVPIEAIGLPFDPHVHEAIGQVPNEEYEAGLVMHVAQTGYTLHDRVIRPAQVLVSAGPSPTVASEEQEGSEEKVSGDNARGRDVSTDRSSQDIETDPSGGAE